MFSRVPERAISGNSQKISVQIPGDQVVVLRNSMFRDGISRNFHENPVKFHGNPLAAP